MRYPNIMRMPSDFISNFRKPPQSCYENKQCWNQVLLIYQ